MTAARRGMLWPLVVIAVGCVWLLMVAGALPEAVGDLMVRAWPALLILFGFDVLFGRRQLRVAQTALSANVIGVAATLVLLAALVWLAYERQADVVRSDQTASFSQALGDEIEQVQIEINLQRTTVNVQPVEGDTRDLGAVFTGSEESVVTMDWAVEGDTGILTVTERYENAIPRLEDYGRGTLDLTLPVGVPVMSLFITGVEGDTDFDFGPLRVDQLNVAVGSGDLRLDLPRDDVLTGVLKTENGRIDLVVPQEVALTVSLAPGSGTPRYEYDSLRYDVLLNGTVKRKNTESFQVGLTVWLDGGDPLVIEDVE